MTATTAAIPAIGTTTGIAAARRRIESRPTAATIITGIGTIATTTVTTAMTAAIDMTTDRAATTIETTPHDSAR